ncbi:MULTISPECIES: cold-shock protein [unclassified Lentimicrobium]|uniref:cold-shock protein n=1 Tax=unclassified Lentimicrobium TaxID=2677434 RepID=UPI0015560384|nr:MULTISPECIES: cold shock domain-containing protein [unclassified Lentimicrobium]NPD46656.1 cold shock domain-containing protein [Lentimicrobium sp. S6]NPD85481.1 cold shock domain-containing protein [Lentimicrobium sp. L6]
MAKSQETYNKKEKEKLRAKKKKAKQQKKEERKNNAEAGGGFESMLAYVDENGQIVDTPPDPTKKTKIALESIEIGVPKRDRDEVIGKRRGKVEFFNDTKGFGFIKEQDTQEKFFVHINSVTGKIKENDIVLFDVERGMKGMNAVRVEIAK